MTFSPYINTFALFFSLLNPFLMSIYMIGLIRHTETKVFNKGLIQGGCIAYLVFLLFAWGGEAIFSNYLNVRFESFQIFGGLIFLVIGYRYVFQGADTIGEMRGAPEHLAGTVAMPFMVGPDHQCCGGYGNEHVDWRGGLGDCIHHVFNLWYFNFNEVLA